MLVFQLDSLAAEGGAIREGDHHARVYEADSDTVTTYTKGERAAQDLTVRVVRPAGALPVGMPGQATESIKQDIEALCGTDADPSLHLDLLQYHNAGTKASDIWPLKRELRRIALDLCVDASSLIVGYARRRAGDAVVREPLNLVERVGALGMRDGPLVQRSGLQNKTVVVIGLGSVGSLVVSDLARSGIGKFVLGDGQRLEWGNVVRHAAGLSDVGRRKSAIAADIIKDRNPSATIVEIPHDLNAESQPIYEESIAAADLLICATDSQASRLLSNRLSLRHKKPALFCGLTAGAYAGMVFRCRPFETICYHCFVTTFKEAGGDRAPTETAYSGGPDAHLAVDIGPIANLVAKLGLVELGVGSSDVSHAVGAELSAPWYLWINRREREYAPSGNSDGDGPRPLQWYPVHMERSEECPHCGVRALGLTGTGTGAGKA
jgi:molybdopterin-synthase adenylyltransferase